MSLGEMLWIFSERGGVMIEGMQKETFSKRDGDFDDDDASPAQLMKGEREKWMEGREEMSTQLLWLPERGSSNGTWHSGPLLHTAGGGGREWALTAGRKYGREEVRAAEERLQGCMCNQLGGIQNTGLFCTRGRWLSVQSVRQNQRFVNMKSRRRKIWSDTGMAE